MGALCTPDVNNKSIASFVIWFGRKQVFWGWGGGGGSTFPNQMNRSISTPSWGPPCKRTGWGRFLEKNSFSFPCFLSSLLARLFFSAVANIRRASKASFHPVFSRLRVYLLLPSLYDTSRVGFLCCICTEEEEEEEKEWRGEWFLLFRTDAILCLSGGGGGGRMFLPECC